MSPALRARKAVLVPLAIGIAAGLVTLARAAFGDARHVLVGWIAAYGLAAATILGAMVLVMVLHLTGARWWLLLRGIFVAMAGTAPILVPLFIPIGAAATLVYPWSTPPIALPERISEALEHQRLWNQPGPFVVRSAVYLVTWAGLALLLRRADAAHLRGRAIEAELVPREKTISAAGLPILAFTLTFASFDWLMSLQPGWSSSAFGLYVFTSGLVCALSAISIAAWLTTRSVAAHESETIGPDHAHALGRLLLMAVILWAYIGFFQLLLVWIANLPHEVSFYADRVVGSWAVVSGILLVGRFALPLLLLLSRTLKRSPLLLACTSASLVLTSVVDFAWLALPAVGIELGVLDLAPFVCVLSLVWAYGAHLALVRGVELDRSPEPDPALAESLRYRSP